MTELTVKKDPGILAVEIRSLQQQAQVVILSYAIEIGRRLCEAKAVLKHGQWGEWLKNEVNFSQSSAQNFMKIFERYGSEQISLFGDAKSETLANLPYTKALKLLAVPEDEMDSFMEEHDVEAMSTRELEQAIRERDESREALEEEKAQRGRLEEETAELREAAENAQAELETAEAEASAAKDEAVRLREEIENLKNRPIEVAVQAPTKEMMEEIRASEEEKFRQERETLQKAFEKAEAKAKKAEEKAAKLKDEAESMKAATKAELQKEIDAAAEAQQAAEAEKKEAEDRAADLERKLKLADGDATAFQIYFSSAQENCNRMLGLIKKAQPAQAEKYRTAVRALLASIDGML